MRTTREIDGASDKLALEIQRSSFAETMGAFRHELSNGLRAIIEDANVLLGQADSLRSASAVKRLSAIRSVAENLLEYSRRLDKLCSPEKEGACDPVLIVQDALSLLKQRGRGVEFTFKQGVFRAQCGMPEAELHQVVLSILLNAIASGASRIRVSIYCRSDKGERRALIRIEDNGTGMEPCELSKAFDVFFTTTQGRGTGLGLPISKAILARYGGEVTLESSPGKGTSAILLLPLHEQA